MDSPDGYSAMVTKVAILGTRYPDFTIEEEVLASAGASIVAAPGRDEEEIVAAADGAIVIVAGSQPRFTRSVLERLVTCQGIVRAGVGVDSIDLEAAADLNLWVVSVPDYGTEAVAQHTLALALAATRGLCQADRIVKTGGWGFSGLRPLHSPGALTAGVVGFGRIGRRLAGLLLSVGFGRLLAHDPLSEPDAHRVEPASLERLLAESDLVCLHAPAPADGRPLLGTAQLAVMRPNSVLVNTSRGSLIDQEALAAALAAGAPRLAALDVFCNEPPDLAVFETVIDRLLLSPHMAWYTEESEADLRRKSAEEARRILTGVAPLHPVVVRRRPNDTLQPADPLDQRSHQP
jgi:D-3-phosphoglycerate dehydrogenase